MTTTVESTWAQRVRELAAEQDAVILAHNYQAPEIQDVADHVGDSLALSRIAARSQASTIVFAGVHFMAETAKLLSRDKRVLIPDANAGCSLADSLSVDQLRRWKREHPRRRRRHLRQHLGGRQGRVRHLLHQLQRRRGRRIHPRRQGDPLRTRPVPGSPRAAGDRPRHHPGVDG